MVKDRCGKRALDEKPPRGKVNLYEEVAMDYIKLFIGGRYNAQPDIEGEHLHK